MTNETTNRGDAGMHNERPEWHRLRACVGVSPALFFPGDGYDERIAKRLCAGCPVKELCLEQAITEHEHVGIWGGLNAADRRRLIRARRRGVAAPLVALAG